MESKGQQVVGSEGGRGSYGGGREWCGVMERGSSPGLVPARRRPCLLVVARVRASLPVSVHVRGWSFSSTHGRLRSRTCLWALVITHAVLAASMSGGAGRLRLLVVLGPCHHSWLVGWSRCCVVVGLCRHSRPWGGPLTVCGVGAPPVRCPACTCIRCIERRAEEGCQ